MKFSGIFSKYYRTIIFVLKEIAIKIAKLSFFFFLQNFHILFKKKIAIWLASKQQKKIGHEKNIIANNRLKNAKKKKCDKTLEHSILPMICMH